MADEFFDTAECWLNQEGEGDTRWANFGYWAQSQTYPQAAQALARLLAKHCGLQAGHRVLDLGFGMGEQLRLWQQSYAVDMLCGVNPSASQMAVAQQRIMQPADLHCAFAQQAPALFGTRCFDRIVALDCAYHFPQRDRLWAQLAECLSAQGQLAWTDLYLGPHQSSRRVRLGRHAICRASRIPLRNLHTLQTWHDVLARAGLRLTLQQDITQQVFAPFARWWADYRQHYVVPRRARLKFELTACVLKRAARHDVMRYGLFVAEPLS